jgi:hypothetical protein
MNTTQIEKALKQRVNHFKGVFPIDRLPASFSLPAIFIINHDREGMPGSHWVSISITDTGVGTYFDSYGLEPIQKYLKFFLRLHTKHWNYNKQRLQGVISTVCGQYSCVFALYESVGLGLETFTNQFSTTNFCFNDQLVIDMYREYFGACQPCDLEEQRTQRCLAELDILKRG